MKRYLAIPGALLLITAFIRSAVNVEWDRTGVALAAAGAVIVLITLVWNWKEVVEWLRDPRGVFAVTTGITVAVFVAAIVMLNIAVWYNPWSLDLTASGRNQVTEETRRILSRLEKAVVLRQFGPAAPHVEQLLRTFERESPRIRVEVVDPTRERDQAIRYGISRDGSVVVLADDSFRKVEEPNEQSVLTAILQATTNEKRIVCFVTGHGERGLPDKGPGGLAALPAAADQPARGRRAGHVRSRRDCRGDAGVRAGGNHAARRLRHGSRSKAMIASVRVVAKLRGLVCASAVGLPPYSGCSTTRSGRAPS
jgi:hypothetical protein